VRPESLIYTTGTPDPDLSHGSPTPSPPREISPTQCITRYTPEELIFSFLSHNQFLTINLRVTPEARADFLDFYGTAVVFTPDVKNTSKVVSLKKRKKLHVHFLVLREFRVPAILNFKN